MVFIPSADVVPRKQRELGHDADDETAGWVCDTSQLAQERGLVSRRHVLDNSNGHHRVEGARSERHRRHGSPNRLTNLGEFDATEAACNVQNSAT